MFLQAREYLSTHGYLDIAMDHFAKEDDELAVAYKNKVLHRNFMGYTVQEPRESIGFGLSSISYIDHTFIQNEKNLNEYYQCIENYDYPIKSSKELDANDRERQWIINTLMCTLELKTSEFERIFKKPFMGFYKSEIDRLRELAKEGFLEINEEGIFITLKGRLFMRNICSVFDTYYQQKKQKFSKAI